MSNLHTHDMVLAINDCSDPKLGAQKKNSEQVSLKVHLQKKPVTP